MFGVGISEEVGGQRRLAIEINYGFAGRPVGSSRFLGSVCWRWRVFGVKESKVVGGLGMSPSRAWNEPQEGNPQIRKRRSLAPLMAGVSGPGGRFDFRGIGGGGGGAVWDGVGDDEVVKNRLAVEKGAQCLAGICGIFEVEKMSDAVDDIEGGGGEKLMDLFGPCRWSREICGSDAQIDRDIELRKSRSEVLAGDHGFEVCGHGLRIHLVPPDSEGLQDFGMGLAVGRGEPSLCSDGAEIDILAKGVCEVSDALVEFLGVVGDGAEKGKAGDVQLRV